MGVATYKFRVSNHMAMIGELHQKYIEHSQMYALALLPIGAKILSCNRSPIVDISTEYVLEIEHPVFIDGAEIKDTMKFKRDIGFTEKGELECINVHDNLNFDEFVRKDKPELEFHADGVKELK